ncbi:Nop domain-containing protein [Neoconidiobolus thromboides FSU 785]|nr:Nop domain-containing protein [Neoconidiobolus thromboides FSU 785]
MSLAQELLDDLDDSMSEGENYENENEDKQEDSEGEMEEDQDEKEDSIERKDVDSINSGSIESQAKLLKSKEMIETLRKIEEIKKDKDKQETKLIGIMEQDPQYKLIVSSNTLVAEIDNELVTVIKFIRDNYITRFKGLDTLITSPLDYVRTVKMIGKEKDLTKLNLKSILTPVNVMILTVANTDLVSREIDDKSLQEVLKACDMALELDEAQKILINFVESRMNYIAPNLSAVVGTTTAAKLLGVAGGLNALGRIPACNLQTLGSSKSISAGFSKAATKNHFGFIYYSEIVKEAPVDERRRMARFVANKAALAVRIDLAQASRDGSQGKALKEEVRKKLDVVMQPPPSKNIKALPVPDDGPKKRRGGRRARKNKESLAQTELRKAQNRVNFGEAEDEAHGLDSSVGLGTMTSNRGKIRAAAIDTRTKTSVSKKYKAMLSKTNSNVGGTITSGFTTSLAFTPVQGIELENPDYRKQKVKEANDKYFGVGQSFINVKKKE